MDNKYFFKLNLNKFTLGLDWILEGTVFQTLAPRCIKDYCVNEVPHLGRLKLSVPSTISIHLGTNMIKLGQILGNKGVYDFIHHCSLHNVKKVRYGKKQTV